MNTPTEHQVTIKMPPFPAVRVNGKRGRFAPRAIAYHDKLKALRVLVEQSGFKPSEKIGITFVFPMPKSWSNKKCLAMYNQPHKQTPDLDNCIKAVVDCIYNGYLTDVDDSRISEYWPMSKRWGLEGMIIIFN